MTTTQLCKDCVHLVECLSACHVGKTSVLPFRKVDTVALLNKEATKCPVCNLIVWCGCEKCKRICNLEYHVGYDNRTGLSSSIEITFYDANPLRRSVISRCQRLHLWIDQGNYRLS